VDRDSYRVRSLVLVLVGSVVFLTTVQCIRRFTPFASKTPVIAGVRLSTAAHTPEEVSDKGFDISRDANNQSRELPTEPEQSPVQYALAEDAEIGISPLRQLLHRRISPSSPDDAFHFLPR
jgi:hypothetical protein